MPGSSKERPQGRYGAADVAQFLGVEENTLRQQLFRAGINITDFQKVLQFVCERKRDHMLEQGKK